MSALVEKIGLSYHDVLHAQSADGLLGTLQPEAKSSLQVHFRDLDGSAAVGADVTGEMGPGLCPDPSRVLATHCPLHAEVPHLL